MVTLDRVYWAKLPNREEAGSPNVVGTYALSRTLEYLQSLNMNQIDKYEQDLTIYALNKLLRKYLPLLFTVLPPGWELSASISKIYTIV